jgi:hypothetical protein
VLSHRNSYLVIVLVDLAYNLVTTSEQGESCCPGVVRKNCMSVRGKAMSRGTSYRLGAYVGQLG